MENQQRFKFEEHLDHNRYDLKRRFTVCIILLLTDLSSEIQVDTHEMECFNQMLSNEERLHSTWVFPLSLTYINSKRQSFITPIVFQHSFMKSKQPLLIFSSHLTQRT